MCACGSLVRSPRMLAVHDRARFNSPNLTRRLPSLSESELDAMMDEVDTNGDGEISFEEFKELMVRVVACSCGGLVFCKKILTVYDCFESERIRKDGGVEHLATRSEDDSISASDPVPGCWSMQDRTVHPGPFLCSYIFGWFPGFLVVVARSVLKMTRIYEVSSIYPISCFI